MSLKDRLVWGQRITYYAQFTACQTRKDSAVCLVSGGVNWVGPTARRVRSASECVRRSHRQCLRRLTHSDVERICRAVAPTQFTPPHQTQQDVLTPTPLASLVRYKNRPFGHRRRHMKRLTVVGAIWGWRNDELASRPLSNFCAPMNFCAPIPIFFNFKLCCSIVQAIFKMLLCCGFLGNTTKWARILIFDFGAPGVPPKGAPKIEVYETPRTPPQQFLCPFQKINSCFGTFQMAPVPSRQLTVADDGELF